jgi:Flp pilus assembly protein TadB
MAGALITAGGLILLGYLLYDELVQALRPALRARGIELFSEFGGMDWKAYVPIPIGFITAFLMRSGILVALYMAALGVGASLYMARRTRRLERAKLDKEIASLVEAFRSIYRIRPAIFSALEEARLKTAEPIKSQVSAAVEAYYATASPERAFAELRERVSSPYLDQFVYILQRSEAADRDDQLNALAELIERLRRRETLRRKTKTNLTVITLQTRGILFISVGIIVVIAMIPQLRTVWTASLGGQLFFIVLVSFAAFMASVIDRRVVALQERVL